MNETKNTGFSVDVSNLSKDQQTNYMLQKLIDDYLKMTKSPSMSDILAQSGKKEVIGELTTEHNIILQYMVKDYYQAIGLSLDDTLKSKNIEFKEGVLSKVEQECVEKLLVDYCESVTNYLQSVLKSEMAE